MLTGVFLFCLCSCGVGVFPGFGSDLAAGGQRLSAHESRLLVLHPAEAAGFWHLQQVGPCYPPYPIICQVSIALTSVSLNFFKVE